MDKRGISSGIHVRFFSKVALFGLAMTAICAVVIFLCIELRHTTDNATFDKLITEFIELAFFFSFIGVIGLAGRYG